VSELANILKLARTTIQLAKKAALLGEVPVGAILVKDNKIVAQGYQKIEQKTCQVFHAEVEAILKASKKIKNWRLNGYSLITTLRPCPMCAYLCKLCRINTVYYFLDNPLTKTFGTFGLKIQKLPDLYNYEKILKDFFKEVRIKKPTLL